MPRHPICELGAIVSWTSTVWRDEDVKNENYLAALGGDEGECFKN